jgi:hypothetical protein
MLSRVLHTEVTWAILNDQMDRWNLIGQSYMSPGSRSIYCLHVHLSIHIILGHIKQG